MVFSFDYIRGIVIVSLSIIGLNPLSISAMTNKIQAIDYHQFHLIKLVDTHIHILEMLESPEKVYPIAIVISIISIRHIYTFINMYIIHCHYVIESFDPLEAGILFGEYLWHFIYCTTFPLIFGGLIYRYTTNLLSTFCLELNPSHISTMSEASAIIAFLVAGFITDTYEWNRKQEIELMTLPPE